VGALLDPELTGVVAPPATNGAALGARAAMPGAAGDLHGVLDLLHHDGGATAVELDVGELAAVVGRSPVAELAGLALAPTRHTPAAQPRAGEVASQVHLLHLGQAADLGRRGGAGSLRAPAGRVERLAVAEAAHGVVAETPEAAVLPNAADVRVARGPLERRGHLDRQRGRLVERSYALRRV